MVATIEKFHCEPRLIDSSFSELFCDILLKKVDGHGLFLSEEDVNLIKETSYKLSSDIEQNECSFFNSFSGIISDRINSVKLYLFKLENEAFDLIQNDSITIDSGNYFVKSNHLEKRWRKWLQYLTINKVEDRRFEKLQIDSVYREVLALEQCRINSYFINNSLEKKVSDWYLTALANTYDPHTTYFSNDVKENFDDQLSNEHYTFGFELNRTERGQLEVSAVIPGGAAWNSNKINEGAILNAVIINDVLNDFSCIGYGEAMSILNNNSAEEGSFIFETENGVRDTIKLVKTKISAQENIVQSFIIKDSLRTLGYIYLPSFYTGENNFGIPTEGCSADISRELIRLKKEGIEGLIIDLRGNGGGHMLEAINLVGIFINYGTLGIIDNRDEKSSLIKDMNRGLIYDGPLTVMIDEYSASASEFFAVTMQDYNRAVIVGAKSYGKSTAQTVLPIEAHKYASPSQMSEEPLGFVKVTVSRFYRVNGDTYQRSGVIPDIAFPSFFDEVEIGERTVPNALLAKHIDRETYFSSYHSVPREELTSKFLDKSKDSEYNRLIKNLAKSYAEYRGLKTFSLDINAENKLEDNYLKGLDDYYSFEHTVLFEVNNPSYLTGYSNHLNNKEEMNATVMEDIANDQEIIQAYLITKDLINIKNNK